MPGDGPSGAPESDVLLVQHPLASSPPSPSSAASNAALLSTHRPSGGRSWERLRRVGFLVAGVVALGLLVLAVPRQIGKAGWLRRPAKAAPATPRERVEFLWADEPCGEDGAPCDTTASPDIPLAEWPKPESAISEEADDDDESAEPTSTETTTTTTESPVVDWEVIYEGSVDVREWKDSTSESLGLKWKCTVLSGQQEGDWVKLSDETGYIPLEVDNSTTMRPIPVYAKISNGTCFDVGMYPVNDSETCETAAEAMQLEETRLQNISFVPCPEGCHLFTGKRSTGLYLSTNPLNRGNGAQSQRHPICSSYAEPSRPCAPLTTTMTTSTSTTTWGWPSLFCFSVTKGAGYETKALRDQLARHGGIFACDEFAVFSVFDETKLGDWLGDTLRTKVIPAPEDSPNATSFLDTWRMVKEDGRFRHHDWIAKVSPDTVFFPERLRSSVKQHTTADGLSLYFLKCDKFNPTQLYGLIEVRSRRAMEAYFWGEPRCRDKLDGQGWSEDHFMQECLKLLQVSSVFEKNLLADTSCGSVNCWDKSKVAFHDFPDVNAFNDCWKHSGR
mmetsp:Transcript_79323/g.256872  ORF Transcript_79323/g.256872 Transcript_79323/m.256872 type:complete len:559 (+) Transcript_79323:118-1794(+)